VASSPFALTTFISIGLFFMIMGWKWGITTNPDAKRRLQLVHWGTTVAMTPLFLIIVISRLWKVSPMQVAPTWVLTAALLMMFLFPLTITYVIVVHRALDVRVVVRQGIQYALAREGSKVFFLLMGAAIMLAAVNLALDPGRSDLEKYSLIGFGVLSLFVLQRLRLRLADSIDRRFFRQAYNAERVLSELSDEVRTVVDEPSLLRKVGETISNTLFVPRLTFLVSDNGFYRPAYALGSQDPSEVRFAESAATVRQLRETGAPAQIYFDDEASWIYRTPDMTEEERSTLSKLESQLLLPLAVKEKLVGFMVLGQKKSEEPYSGSDLRLLRSLAAQTGLALENSRLAAAIAHEAAQRERLNRELEIAREVQQRLFPQKTPQVEGLDCAGGCRPALGVGGDYYDFLELADGRLGIVIGDVSGKGIAAALLMASLQASVRGQTLHASKALAQVISHVNTLIYEASASSRYATLFYAQVDPKALTLEYVNAGHNPPLLLRSTGEVEHLQTGGTVVGLLPRFPYQQGSVQLAKGDTLLMFTDGISEAFNGSDEEYGEDRLMEAMRRSGERTATELIPYLIDEVDAFVAGAPQHDDMTLVIARIQ
jgi:sigma-B regulation protein RsbU (phosphoserine phosphatase)